MAAIGLTNLGLTDFATQTGTPKIGRIEPSDATGQRFAAAMEKANPSPAGNPPAGDPPVGDPPVADPQPVDAASRVLPSKPATDAAGGTTADAQERARRGLNLDPAHAAPPKPTHGEAILHGLENIRSAFGAQEARLNNLMSRPAADTNTLLAMQMEVTKFSVLVDVTSKLVGKSTQAFESLLKGQ
jgi:type III secretion system YscI/HrpB-like protein